MIARIFWPLLLMTGFAQAATLPLKPGTFVQTSVPCKDPPFAAMFDYDGRALSYPHASHCRSAIASHEGRFYHVRETCTALGDGSAAAPSTSITLYKILSRQRVDVGQGGKASVAYRWCPAVPGRKAS